jgi:hypothetical protein
MAKARDDFAERVEQRRDEWVQKELDNGTSMTDVFGVDVPYKDFFTEGAANYVAENIEIKVAGTALATGVSAAAVAGGMSATYAAVMPSAFSAQTLALVKVGAVAGVSVKAVVAAPAAIAGAAVVGSIVRGIQVFENVKQEGIYNDLVGSVGRPVIPSSISLTTDSGKDDVINQTILMGAIVEMIFF